MNTKRQKVKVLELEPWMLRDRGDHRRDQLLGTARYPEIAPVFNRPGIYLRDGAAWIEINNTAFEYSVTTFEYSLRMFNAMDYNLKQIKALREIHIQRLATKRQRSLLYDIRSSWQIRNSNRHGRLEMHKILKQFRREGYDEKLDYVR